jgi:hypothetical protein
MLLKWCNAVRFASQQKLITNSDVQTKITFWIETRHSKIQTYIGPK